MQAAASLADDVQDRGGEEKGVDFVQDGINRLLAVIVPPGVEALLEKAREGIDDARRRTRARKSASVRSRGNSASEALGVSMSAMSMAKNLFERRAPHVAPDGAHAGDDAVGDDGS